MRSLREGLTTFLNAETNVTRYLPGNRRREATDGFVRERVSANCASGRVSRPSRIHYAFSESFSNRFESFAAGPDFCRESPPFATSSKARLMAQRLTKRRWTTSG